MDERGERKFLEEKNGSTFEQLYIYSQTVKVRLANISFFLAPFKIEKWEKNKKNLVL